jgi:hypothetical protein
VVYAGREVSTQVWLSIELALRAPASLSPAQSLVVVAVVVGVLLALAIGSLVEGVLGGCLGFLLRLAGHRPPRKGPVASALDELEARIERERRDGGTPPER